MLEIASFFLETLYNFDMNESLLLQLECLKAQGYAAFYLRCKQEETSTLRKRVYLTKEGWYTSYTEGAKIFNYGEIMSFFRWEASHQKFDTIEPV